MLTPMLTRQIEKEIRLRGAIQDELEAKYREAEGSLAAVREECDAVHEELAFKESREVMITETRYNTSNESNSQTCSRIDYDPSTGTNSNSIKHECHICSFEHEEHALIAPDTTTV